MFSASLLPPHLISAGQVTKTSQRVAADDLSEGFPQLLAPECINERVNDGVTHDQDEVQVKVRHEAHTVWVLGTGDVEYQVEEEGRPADHKNPDQDG